jgi:hypothetical protein
MTIAACYLSPEGVVLGADSAATFGSRNHFFYEQKIFEIGKEGESTLGLTLWGLGSLGEISYRTILARFSDEIISSPNQPVEELAERWKKLFWDVYTVQLGPKIDRLGELGSAASRSAEEDEEFDDLVSGYSGGFCLGGHSLPDRIPKAFSITYSLDESEPSIEEIKIGVPEFWGQPNMLRRLSWGIAVETFSSIIEAKKPDGSPMWSGSVDDLAALVVENKLGQPSKHLPVREAIDWVYSSIYTTIKAMKFANLPPVCGGPIEVAVITSDRSFRWVRHKDFEAAIGRHPTREL